MSPTQLSLRWLREHGYLAEVVEHYSSFDRKRHDLWGFVDILAIRRNEVLAVQTTTASHVSDRMKKIADSPYVGLVREAGIGIAVHGWSQKAPRARWTLTRNENLS
jgi:hypothetical protein